MNGPRLTTIGNLTTEPSLQYTPNEGRPYLRMTVASNTWRGEDAPDETYFFNFTLWGDRAERSASRVRKGGKCLVEGRFSVQNFVRADGSPGQSFNLHPVSEFHYFGHMTAAPPAAYPEEDAAAAAEAPEPEDDYPEDGDED